MAYWLLLSEGFTFASSLDKLLKQTNTLTHSPSKKSQYIIFFGFCRPKNMSFHFYIIQTSYKYQPPSPKGNKQNKPSYCKHPVRSFAGCFSEHTGTPDLPKPPRSSPSVGPSLRPKSCGGKPRKRSVSTFRGEDLICLFKRKKENPQVVLG